MSARAILAAAVFVGFITSGCDGAGRGGSFAQPPPGAPRAGSPATQPSAAAAADLPEKPALSDLLKYAALHNRQLKAAFHRWKAALERVPQAEALPDPRFTYRYFIEEVETRVGAQRQSFELSQTFPWFGKLQLRGGAAMAAADATRQQYETVKLKLFYVVKDAYYEYYYLGRAVAVTRENLRLVKLLEAVVRTRYKAAAAGHPEVIRAQVELGKLTDRLASLEELRGPVTARLNAALNRPPAAPLGEWPAAIEEEKVSFKDEDCLTWLAENNPELKGLDFQIARRQKQIELARKGYFPDVTLGASYIDVADSIGGRHPPDDGKDAVIAMVSVNLPIWWDKLAAGVREARRERLAAVMARQDRLNWLGAELKMALYRFRDAHRKLGLYRDTLVPKAKEAFKATEAAYRAGKATFSDLMDAERVLLEFQLSFERALADRAARLAELEMLIGREIPRKSGSPARQRPTNE